MNNILDSFIHFTNFINKFTGRIVSLLILIIILIASFEVIMRYFFRAPTIWAWDINVQLLAVIVFFGGGYLLHHDGHVRVDVIYGQLSKRSKIILDLIVSPIFFIYLIVLLWKFIILTINSIVQREVTNTLFAPPVYPLKIICCVALFFFLLQGVAIFILNLRSIINNTLSKD